ncbi:unnamed protein product [Rhodiola kirilowii]
MAQTITSTSGGLRGSSQPVLESSLGSNRLIGAASNGRLAQTNRSSLVVKASSVNSTETGRRAVLGLVSLGLASGSFVQVVLADAKKIPIGPPPPPSGGLPGTLNSDEARDFNLPLKKRFYLQPLPPTEAAARAKESAKDIINVKELIDKKAWPYVQNDLRSKAEYLRYDINTVISAKPKAEKQELKELSGKLFESINNLDYAAKIKSTSEAEKAYAATVSTLNDVLAKLG